MEAEDEKNMKEPNFVPGAVSEPRWAVHVCDDKCREKGFKFFEIAAVVSARGAADTINLCKTCCNVRRLKHGEEEVRRSKVEGAGRAEVFPREVVDSVWCGPVLA